MFDKRSYLPTLEQLEDRLAPATLVPVASSWKFLDDGSNQGTAWRAPGFNDTNWSSGVGQLGYGDGDENTVITPGKITYYFRKAFHVNGGFSSLKLQLLRDDGAVVYLNGTQVFRSNMPAGAVHFNTLASTEVGGAAESKFFQKRVNPDLLLKGENVLAVEIHQRSSGNPDASFELALTGSRASASFRVARGGVNFLRAVIDPVSGLPYNEASQSELDATPPSFASDHFVPAQLGNWLSVAVLGHAFRRKAPGFVAGFTNQELISQLNKTVGSLEAILADPQRVFTDSGTGGTGAKALYQAYDTRTGEPRTDDFARNLSLLDNVQLIAGLQVTANYLRSIASSLGNLQATANNIAARIDDALDQFNVRMWLVGGKLHLGAQDNPRGGDEVDRITSEGRLAPVVALARGEITLGEFNAIVNFMISESKGATGPGGVTVERLPFFGTALEIWAVTPYLSNELSTLFGTQTLEPLARAWREKATQLGLPAAGATGIADGFGNFVVFGLSPAESSPAQFNKRVLIPPAAGMMAGALGTSSALLNLANAMAELESIGLFHDKYGAPNYRDFGTGLVDSSDPVRGTLEIAQMTVSLLNRQLGGRFLEDLLRRQSAWSTALDSYAARLNVHEAESSPAGAGSRIPRSNASSDAVWHLAAAGDTVRYTLQIGTAGNYDLRIRYSNDDAGPGDDITVLLNGTQVGSFHTTDTLDWNAFTESPIIPLGSLGAGPFEIAIRITTTDGFGIDLDRFELF